MKREPKMGELDCDERSESRKRVGVMGEARSEATSG
jgi:hypothetical protein